MHAIYKLFMLSLTVLSIFAFNYNLHAGPGVVNPSPEEEAPVSPGELKSLDLSYVYGGDYVLGKILDEKTILQKIIASPNLIELNLTGQLVTPAIMTGIHDHLLQLNKLIINGSVRYNNGDGDYYSSEVLNEQAINADMLQALFSNGSTIEILDFSLSTIDDAGLEQISLGAHNLSEIYLKGAKGITDSGLSFLFAKVPTLKVIDLRSVTLKRPMDNDETLAPQVSKDLINNISSKGIIVIQDDLWR